MQMCRDAVKYLGHELITHGHIVLSDWKTAVLQAPKPLFLGLTSYCRAWIPNFAEITEPLQQLMHAVPMEMKTPLKWTTAAEMAFCKLKKAQVASTTLALPDYCKPFVQMVDSKREFNDLCAGAQTWWQNETDRCDNNVSWHHTQGTTCCFYALVGHKNENSLTSKTFVVHQHLTIATKFHIKEMHNPEPGNTHAYRRRWWTTWL